MKKVKTVPFLLTFWLAYFFVGPAVIEARPALQQRLVSALAPFALSPLKIYLLLGLFMVIFATARLLINYLLVHWVLTLGQGARSKAVSERLFIALVLSDTLVAVLCLFGLEFWPGGVALFRFVTPFLSLVFFAILFHYRSVPRKTWWAATGIEALLQVLGLFL